MRRIVQYPTFTHYSEIKISPQWHQWLRHTRSDPPSLTEQSQDLIRQQNLKVLAAEADARWAAEPSLLDSPGQARGQPLPAIEVKDPGGYTTSTQLENRTGVLSAIAGAPDDMAHKTGIPAAESEGKEGHNGKMQVPDGIRHHFHKWPTLEKSPKAAAKKGKEDPWKQARGGPSEKWRPESWSGNLAARR
jgi:NADH dehydrogenase [ubiquinone] 1 alpha subcomplex assembly factor 2